jgi:hypothetical protein
MKPKPAPHASVFTASLHIWRLGLAILCVSLQLLVALLPAVLAIIHPTLAPVITHTSLTSSGQGAWSEDDDVFAKDHADEQEQGYRQLPLLQGRGLEITSLFLPRACQRLFALPTSPLSIVFYPLKLAPVSSSDNDPFLS